MDLELIEKQLKHAISIVQEMKCNQNEKTETLKMSLLEIMGMLETDDGNDESTNTDDDYDSDDSDASFTREESTYIKNESHREYLKRYSLKPQFPLHYYNADRDK